MLLLLLFPVLLFSLPWVLPRRWLPAFGLVVLYCAIYLFINEIRAQCAGCGGVGEALGWAFFVFTCFGFSFSFIARWVIPIFAKKKETKPESGASSSGTTTALLALGLSCVMVYQVVKTASYWFDDGFLVHCAVVVLALCWVAIGWFYRGRHEQHADRRFTAIIFSGVGAVTTLCALAWSLQVPYKAIAAAEEAAAGEPYCLLTSGRKGLRPSRNRLDLSGFVMQDGPVSSRHATLAIGESRTPAWHYWSYRKGAFEREFLGGVLSCDLQHNAAKNLNWFQAKAQSQEERFWLARGQWHIPANYLGGGRDHPPVMTFYARGEDFGPLPARSQKPVFDMEMLNAQVQVTLCDLETLHVWQAQNDTNHKVEPAGMEAGLEKQSVESRGSPRKEFQYIGRDKTGRISTWLLCHEGGDICRHAFRREGMVVEFQHSRSQFAQWKDTQDAVWKRVKSFAVVWPDTGPQSCKS